MKCFFLEFETDQRIVELPVLATSWSHQTDQSLHIQRDKSGQFPPVRREAETTRSRTFCLPVSRITLLIILYITTLNVPLFHIFVYT